jgi:hypothetical protein
MVTEDAECCGAKDPCDMTMAAEDICKNVFNLALMFIYFSTMHCSLLRLIVRSGLDVPTFATRRLHVCHHARPPSGGRWNCGREMSGNFA